MKKNKLFCENLFLIDLPGEIWVDCIDYEGTYEISNFGRLKSLSRWIDTRNGGGYMSTEKLRKQTVSKKFSTIRSYLCREGIVKPFTTSRLVFFSFNKGKKPSPEQSVMHKNNDWTDNRLENLKIGTQREISTLTFKKGKMEHLKKGNPMLSKHNRKTAIIENGKIVKKKCTKCNKYKKASFFRIDKNECAECAYYGRYGLERKHGFKIKVTDLLTKKITIFKNFNDSKLLKLVTIPTAMKYAKSGEIYKPYCNSRNRNGNPLLIKQLK